MVGFHAPRGCRAGSGSPCVVAILRATEAEPAADPPRHTRLRVRIGLVLGGAIKHAPRRKVATALGALRDADKCPLAHGDLRINPGVALSRTYPFFWRY